MDKRRCVDAVTTNYKYPRECARCGADKPPWFEYCGKCYASVQIEHLEPNRCDEQDCNRTIPEDFILCREHYSQFNAGEISECPNCGEFKPSNYPLCRRCNEGNAAAPASRTKGARVYRPAGAGGTTNTRRPYDQHDGEDDQKAKDKRYWFNHQDNGVCNYCGRRCPYDKLEMEHMVPKELGGPDHRRNMQLACQTCNQKKGTSTDIEFRQLNADLIPQEERTPPRRSIDPERLKVGNQGGRYRQPQRQPGRGTSQGRRIPGGRRG